MWVETGKGPIFPHYLHRKAFTKLIGAGDADLSQLEQAGWSAWTRNRKRPISATLACIKGIHHRSSKRRERQTGKCRVAALARWVQGACAPDSELQYWLSPLRIHYHKLDM